MIILRKGVNPDQAQYNPGFRMGRPEKNFSPRKKIQIWALLGCRIKLRACSFMVVWSYRLDIQCIQFSSVLFSWYVFPVTKLHSSLVAPVITGTFRLVMVSFCELMTLAVSNLCFNSCFTALIEYLTCSAYMSCNVTAAWLQNTHHSFRVSDVRSQRDSLKSMCFFFLQ